MDMENQEQVSVQGENEERASVHTTEEIESQSLVEAQLTRFFEDGFFAVPGAVTHSWCDEAVRFISNLNPAVKFGGLRIEFSLAYSQPLFDPQRITSNAALRMMLEQILGTSYSLVRVGAIMSFPGSEDQEIHRDGQPLFDHNEMDGRILPTHAVHVWVPVTPNYSKEAGATSFFPGTHRTFGQSFEDLNLNEGAAVSPIIPLGSCLIFDDRIFHYGGANNTSEVRTCVFFSFARPWFTDGTAEADRNTTAWIEIE